MENLSEHFTKHEMTCKCGCGLFIYIPEVISELENIRAIYAKPLIVVSGVRCKNRNDKVGGKPASRHLLGEAVDFYIKGISPDDVYHELCKRYPIGYGIGHYHTFTHFDIRHHETARWSG